MQARLSAVQQALIVVTVVAFVVAVLAHPTPSNARYRRALAELTSIDERFDQARVEQLLQQSVQRQARKPLRALVQQVRALRPVELRLKDAKAALDPIVHVQLATLADIDHFSQRDVTLPMAVPNLASLERGLAWRLARDAPPNATVTLTSARLQAAQLDAAAVGLETQVLQLQTSQQEATAAAERASTQLEAIEGLYDARVKRHASRPLRVETYKARLEARRALRGAKRALRTSDRHYETAAASALSEKKLLSNLPLPRYGVVEVELEEPGGHTSYAIPVSLTIRRATVAPLGGASFRQTRAAGLWGRVKALSVAQAREFVRRQFNWHYRYFVLGGLKLGGMTVLQLSPCILPLLLLLLLARVRAATLTYNPFQTRVPAALPRVGFRARLLDALAVVAMPLLAATFAIASLMLVGQLPALPLVAAVTSLLLGGYAYMKLGELQQLIEDVVRLQSSQPTDPE